jgi:hypothetical protein
MPAADVRGCLRGADGRLGGHRAPRGNGAAALRGNDGDPRVAVGVGTAIIGTSTAWLVTATRFPGHRILEVALALPLAFPAYVLAYAYTDFLDHPGIVQTTLRDLTGWGPRDYWFPEIRSTGGAAAMLTFVLYPYVYLLARAAFMRQSATAYIAARTLGRGAVGRVLQGLGAGGPPGHRGRCPAGADGDARGLRHRRPISASRPSPPASTSWFSCSTARRRRSLRSVFWPWRWSSPRWNGGKGGFSATTTPGGGSSGWSLWRCGVARPQAVAAVCGLPVVFGFLLPAGILLSLASGARTPAHPALPGVPAAIR